MSGHLQRPEEEYRHHDLEPLRLHLLTLAPREYLRTLEAVYRAAEVAWGNYDPPPSAAGSEVRLQQTEETA